MRKMSLKRLLGLSSGFLKLSTIFLKQTECLVKSKVDLNCEELSSLAAEPLRTEAGLWNPPKAVREIRALMAGMKMGDFSL
jgi:hypothetical protein